MKYVYKGPGPVPDPEGELVHPLDVREFDTEPDWGPWELAEAPESDKGELPGPPEASPAALSAAPALNIAPGAPKGM